MFKIKIRDWFVIEDKHLNETEPMVDEGWHLPDWNKKDVHIDAEEAIVNALRWSRQSDSLNMQIKNISGKNDFAEIRNNNPGLKEILDSENIDIETIIECCVSGIPDIFWWNVRKEEFGFIEVKSSSDSLRRSQLKWMVEYSDLFRCEIAFVEIEDRKSEEEVDDMMEKFSQDVEEWKQNL